jgi:hypothetical protein
MWNAQSSIYDNTETLHLNPQALKITAVSDKYMSKSKFEKEREMSVCMFSPDLNAFSMMTNAMVIRVEFRDSWTANSRPNC